MNIKNIIVHANERWCRAVRLSSDIADKCTALYLLYAFTSFFTAEMRDLSSLVENYKSCLKANDCRVLLNENCTLIIK